MNRSTTPSVRPIPAFSVVVMMGLIPLSLLVFGGVHPTARVGLSVVMTLTALGVCLRGRYVAHRALLIFVGLGLGLAALCLLPVSSAVRTFSHGTLAEPVLGLMSHLGASRRPLALNPNGAAFGLAEATAFFLLGCGYAGWVTRVGRARILVWTALGTGVGLVGVMVGHQIFGMASIYGSGVGLGVPDGFFAPFVNQNHGGIYCAMVLPLALSRMAAARGREAFFALASMVVLAFGVWASGSRGAVLSAVLGLVATVAAIGDRRTRLAIVGGLVLGCVGVALVGPLSALSGLTEMVSPSVNVLVDAGYVDLSTGRLALFSEAIAIIGQAPILGVGVGGFELAHRMVVNGPLFSATTHAHNEYLQLFAEHGLVGGTLLLAALFQVLSLGWRSLDQWGNRPDRRWAIAGFLGCLAALGVSATVDFPLRLDAHAILAVSCLGALVGLARPHRGGRRLGRLGRSGVVLLAMVTAGGMVMSGAWMGGLFAPASDARADGQAWRTAATGEARHSGLKAAAAHFGRAAIRGLDRVDIQWLAKTQFSLGEDAAAAKTLQIGTQLHPTMPWLWRDLARVEQNRKNEPEAAQAWTRMLALNFPASTDPLDVLREAIFLGGLGEPLEAAHAVLPERGDRYRQAARLMNQLGLVEEAESLFRHARALEPDGIFHYSAALSAWGRPADAVMLLKPAVRGCAAQTLYAEGLSKIGQHTTAAEAFVKGLSVCGAKSWALRVGLAKARLLSGDTRAEEGVRRLLAERPDDHGLRRAWLWALSQRGRTVEAVGHFQHLKGAGVIRPVEEIALERALTGLPFKLPRPEWRKQPH